MFEFEATKYFYLLLLIPVVGLLFIWQMLWKRKLQKNFAHQQLLSVLAPQYSNFKSIVKFALFVFGLVAISIAMVNPKIGTKMETIKREGIDIVFAIDVSKSMLAEDIAPNRLEKSKQLVSQIIGQLQTDRISMVAYAGSAFPVLPLTSDYTAARMFLQSMTPDMISTQGTSIDEALEQSVGFFDKGQSTSKLVILISDGEDHSNNVETALELAKNENIKVIAIGVGTEKGGTIPIKDKGNLIGFIRDRDNEIVNTKMETETLQQIANATNGGFIDGVNTKEVLAFVKSKIATIEKTEKESTQLADFKSQFQWFLMVAFILFLLETILFDKKTAWIEKLNLFNPKNKTL